MGGGSPSTVRSGDAAASDASYISQHNDADMQDAGGQNGGGGGGGEGMEQDPEEEE